MKDKPYSINNSTYLINQIDKVKPKSKSFDGFQRSLNLYPIKLENKVSLNQLNSIGCKIESIEETDYNIKNLLDFNYIPKEKNSLSEMYKRFFKYLDRKFDRISSKDERKAFLFYFTQLISDSKYCSILHKYLIRKLTNDVPLLKSFFLIIRPIFSKISIHKYGNYIAQSLIKIIDKDLICEALKNMSETFDRVILSIYGTRIVQALVAKVSSEYQIKLLKLMMKRNILFYCLNENSIFSVILFIRKFEIHSGFIFDCFFRNFDQIANEKFGSFFIQNILEYSVIYKERILHTILLNISQLIQSRYGNYILTYILTDIKIEPIKQIALNIVVKNLRFFCMQKYSSHFIERMINNRSHPISWILIEEILNQHIYEDLLFSPYGNFILQALLCKISEPFYSSILIDIAPKLRKIRKLHFGEKLILKLLENHPILKDLIIR